MTKWLFALALAAAVQAIGPAAAQDYPSRPVKLVIPVPPGGAFDVTGRLIAEHMRPPLGQPVIIENVGGGSGNIATSRVARAAPDGYTLSLGLWNTHVVNAAVFDLGYDVVKDFEPIALLATAPQVIVSRNGVPAQDLRGLVAWLRAEPGRATAAIVGVGGVPHIAGVFLEQLTQTRVRFIPYRGGALAVQDLLAGQVDLTILQPAVVLPLVRFTEMGQEVPPRVQQTPEALAALQAAEIAKWWPIVKAAHIEVQ